MADRQSIVAPGLLAIVTDLGRPDISSWLNSAFLLACAATMTLWSHTSDIFGRRACLLVGQAIFGAASLACGWAWNMPALIAFRSVQGIGAAALNMLVFSLVADAVPLRQRGNWQGMAARSTTSLTMAVVLELIALVFNGAGPVLGGVIVAKSTWFAGQRQADV